MARRFFGSVRAKPISPEEADFVSAFLSRPAAEIFWQQQLIDQRHALDAAMLMLQATHERSDLVRAMLLHDVGKRHSRLGIARRVIATFFLLLRLPARGRIRSYLEHGELGALDLEAIGLEGVVVLFARHHAHDRPEQIPADDWALLLAADAERLRPDVGPQYDGTS